MMNTTTITLLARTHNELIELRRQRDTTTVKDVVNGTSPGRFSQRMHFGQMSSRDRADYPCATVCELENE